VEIVGLPSSGRTSLLVAWLGEVTRRGGAAALVDAEETFDPATAARAGVDLCRVLWVRCRGRRDLALRAADLLVRCPGFCLVGLDLGERAPRLPLALAFRLRLQVRRTGTVLVVLARRRVLGSGAGLAVRTVRRGVTWSGPGSLPIRLARVGTGLQVVRCRGEFRSLIPPDRVQWWAA
jgi:hypothetical protein